MTQPFLGQIQAFGFGFAPVGWAQCNGQILSISQSAALFSLLGTMYGGNGTTTFGLPNLQSRVPMHFGTSPGGETYFQGETAGEENLTLTLNMLPIHSHAFVGASQNANEAAGATGSDLANIFNKSTSKPGSNYYTTGGTPQLLNPAELAVVGGGQPHTNIQPYLTINWCIAQRGIFPSRG